jgi:hypothetical protein
VSEYAFHGTQFFGLVKPDPLYGLMIVFHLKQAPACFIFYPE